MATNKAPAKSAADPRAAAQPAAAKPAAKTDEDGEVRPRKKKEEMVSMTVHTAFKLQDDAGEFHEYGLGIQDMPKAHAEHWYTKNHADSNDE